MCAGGFWGCFVSGGWMCAGGFGLFCYIFGAGVCGQPFHPLTPPRRHSPPPWPDRWRPFLLSQPDRWRPLLLRPGRTTPERPGGWAGGAPLPRECVRPGGQDGHHPSAQASGRVAPPSLPVASKQVAPPPTAAVQAGRWRPLLHFRPPYMRTASRDVDTALLRLRKGGCFFAVVGNRFGPVGRRSGIRGVHRGGHPGRRPPRQRKHHPGQPTEKSLTVPRASRL